MPNDLTEAFALIDDDSIPDEQILHLFDWEEKLGPAGLGVDAMVAFPAEDIPNFSTADKGLLGAFNARARRRRQRRYAKRKEEGFDGITIVSEGDSWFQYPIMLDDVIDHLAEREDFNICCLAAGGDWLSNIVQQKEYLATIENEGAQVFLVSGGGNDLVGKERLSWLLRRYKAGRPPEWYLGENIDRALDQLRMLYETMFDELTERWPDLVIVGHGYAHARPDGGEWLGGPMEAIGIEDTQLQRAIVRHMIDRFAEMRIELAERYPNVHFVDCRGLVTKWHDELHPTSKHYGKVAKAFARTIRKALA